MTLRTVRLSALAGAIALAASGLVLAPQLHSAPGEGPAMTSEDAFMKENAVAMERMMSGMEVKPSGDVDRDFTRMMIPHHQGAIDMAQALLKHGKNEELKALARNIIATQSQEIALMRRIGGDPAPAASPSGGMVHHHMAPAGAGGSEH